MTDEAALPESKRVAVIGAGSWGTALALVAAHNGHDVWLWAREPEVASQINRAHKNPYYLSSSDLPENIHATISLEAVLAGADFVLLVVPSHAMREMIERMRELINAETVL